MAKGTLEAVAEVIRGAEHIALCSHISPDGDTIGSALALRLALKSLGKRVDCFCADKVPDNLAMLPGADCYRCAEDAAAFDGDLAMPLDCADIGRMGGCSVLLENAPKSAQVDHHGTNPLYCGVNYVDGDAPAAAMAVKQLIGLLGVPLTRDIAICLYTAISTDTGNFAYDSTNAQAFRDAADLMACGLPLGRLNRALFRERSAAQLKLIGRAVSSIRFYEDGLVSVMKLTAQDFADCGALPEHADTIVNFGLDVVGVKLAALVRDAEGGAKASLRALPPCRVDRAAHALGGGGHELASGCTLHVPLDEAARLIADALCREAREKEA